jgi:hypothetical protein
MKIEHFLQALDSLRELRWTLPNGDSVPAHAHVTEVALMTRRFVDCGGNHRLERRIQLQLWVTNDLEHRLNPAKMKRIIQEAEAWLEWGNYEVEVEYQGNTIEKYGLDFCDGNLVLLPLQTNCLAPDQCGVPLASTPNFVAYPTQVTACKPGSGCC